MQEGKASSSGIRFANDLRRIREARGISIEDLYNETKIPRGLLESFEATGLFEHPMFNRVYLRSFVRTYADVVGISSDIALEALEQAVESQYSGKLADEYLTPESAVEDSTDATVQETVEPGDVAPVNIQDPGKTSGETESTEKEDKTVKPVENRAAATSRVLKEEVPTKTVVTTPGGESAASWLDKSPPTPVFARDRYTRVNDKAWSQWVLIGVAVIVLGGIAWFIIANSGGAGEIRQGPEGNGIASVSDTTAEEVLFGEAVVLGDTIRATIVAEVGKVQNVKVTVDDDVRRPYWIEEGESRTFGFTNQIIIERQLNKIGLHVNEVEYPTDRRDEMNRIVITRDSVKMYLQERV